MRSDFIDRRKDCIILRVAICNLAVGGMLLAIWIILNFWITTLLLHNVLHSPKMKIVFLNSLKGRHKVCIHKYRNNDLFYIYWSIHHQVQNIDRHHNDSSLLMNLNHDWLVAAGYIVVHLMDFASNLKYWSLIGQPMRWSHIPVNMVLNMPPGIIWHWRCRRSGWIMNKYSFM